MYLNLAERKVIRIAKRNGFNLNSLKRISFKNYLIEKNEEIKESCLRIANYLNKRGY